MDFYVGARVESLVDDSPGLKKGEYGTVVRVLNSGDPYIHWEEYNERRHDGYHDLPVGHGWFINKECIKIVEAPDYGELQEGSDIKFLFGDDAI